MTSTDRRRFPAIAALAVAGTALAMLFSTAEAEAETTNFYLWRTTLTVGESSGTLGYDDSESLGSISTDADFGYAPWNPPHKHHVDRESYYTVEVIKSYETQGNIVLEVAFSGGEEIAQKLRYGPGRVSLWLNRTAYPFSVGGADANVIHFRTQFSDTPNVTWKEDDEVKVALVYRRRLPSAPENVSVTAPEGEDGTLEVTWDEADDGTFPIECYLVEFRHPSGEARDRKQSYPGSLGTGKGCGDSPPNSVKRTDLEPGVEYQVLVQALSGDGYGDWSETKLREASSKEREQRQEPDSAPAKPTGLSATATHDRVVLTWDDPGDDSIDGYVILRRNRKTDEKGKFTELVPDTGSAAATYTDATVAASTTYTYRIKAINERGTSERSRWYHIDTPAAPASKPAVADGPPGLAPNAPNPFNANTLIPYRLDADGPVRLEIYNLLGQPVRTLVNQYQDAGFYKVRWDARDQRGALVSAGMYLVRLHYPGGVQTQRLLYLK